MTGLVAAARENVRRPSDGIRLFELGRVFLPSGEPLPREEVHVAGLVQGDFFDVKGVVEALHGVLRVPLTVHAADRPLLAIGRAAAVVGGWFGELGGEILPGGWGAFSWMPER